MYQGTGVYSLHQYELKLMQPLLSLNLKGILRLSSRTAGQRGVELKGGALCSPFNNEFAQCIAQSKSMADCVMKTPKTQDTHGKKYYFSLKYQFIIIKHNPPWCDHSNHSSLTVKSECYTFLGNAVSQTLSKDTLVIFGSMLLDVQYVRNSGETKYNPAFSAVVVGSSSSSQQQQQRYH